MPPLTLTSTSRHPVTPQTSRTVIWNTSASFFSTAGFERPLGALLWLLPVPRSQAVGLRVPSEGSSRSSPPPVPLLLLFPPPGTALLVILGHRHLLTSLGRASSCRRDFSQRVCSHPPNCRDGLLL